MPKGLVIHIENGHDQRVEIWTEPHLYIGVAPESDVRLRDTAWELAGVTLKLVRRDGRYHLDGLEAVKDTRLTYRQAPLTVGDMLDDGGAVRVGDSPLAVRFLPFNPSTTALAGHSPTAFVPFITDAVLESANSPVRNDAIFFVRELSHELWRELRPRTKALIVGLPVLLAVSLLAGGVWLFRERRRSLATINQQTRQITDQEQRINDMRQRLGATDEQLANLDKTQKDTDKAMQARLGIAQRIWRDYRKGVCLITGVYQLTDPDTGRPLRYPENAPNEEGETTGAGTSPLLTTSGKGPLAEYEFVGTGFYVGGGYVLTNRHVVQPWTAVAGATPGGRPRLKLLKAYFAERREALTVRVKMTSDANDVAVCLVTQPERVADLPALPLAAGAVLPPVGSQVIAMGYPAGTNRLLEVLSDKEADELQKRYGSALDSLLKHLAEINLIKPLTTQGYITDVHQARIVFDAVTGEGGSGTPIFGPTGQVVGLSFGILPENRAANIGVAASELIALLTKAGWQPPAATPTPELTATP